MKIRELRELSADELKAKETELVDQLFKLKFQKTVGQLDNPMKIKNVKKEIATIKTLQREMSGKTE
jgi:large subunit ribosomal protein L29